jgi:hypothetical protein
MLYLPEKSAKTKLRSMKKESYKINCFTVVGQLVKLLTMDWMARV